MAGRSLARGVYLLDLVVAGHVYRYATEAVEVTDAAGRSLAYDEGLADPDVSWGSVAGLGDASLPIEIASDVDWALLAARGHALDRCEAVLYRWYEGQVLERSRVVLRGWTAGPVYGARGELLSFALVRSVRSRARPALPPQAVIDATTWPVTAPAAGADIWIPEAADGAPYPLVLGAPGHTEDATPVPCVPVPQAEFAPGVAYGRVVWLGGDAAQVRLRWTAYDTPFDFDLAVGTIEDGLGRVCQTVLTGDSNERGSYLLGFRDDDTYGGGVVWQGRLLRGAGDLIDWVLSTFYDGPVDHGRIDVVRAYLNAWKVDTYIDQPVSAWDWLRREVLPMLPVELREGARGVFPAVLRYDLTSRDVVLSLDATPGSGNCTRVDRAAVVDGDIVNEVTIDFRPSGSSGSAYLSRLVLTAAGARPTLDAAPADDTRVYADPLCTASQRRYGALPLRLQLQTWDATTVVQAARHIVARRAWPHRELQVVGGTDLETLEIGQAVAYTDPDLHLVAALARVDDLTPGPGEVTVHLVLLDRP